MDASALIPVPDTIPAPAGLFHVLHGLTFTLHLLFMNAMLGLALVALVTELRGGGRPASPAARDISRKLPYTIAFTVNMGVAPLLFVQVLFGHFLYTSSVLMAVYWLSVIGLVMAAYYGAYIYEFRFDALGRGRALVLGLSVLLLLLAGFLFTTNMTLMLRPERWSAWFERPGGTILDLSDPAIWPRYLHFVLASAAVGGLLTALIWRYKQRRGTGGPNEPSAADEHIRRGMRWFTHATMAQMVIGIWFLMALPREVILLFMGGNPLHSILLVASVASAIAALVLGLQRRVVPTAAAAVLTVALMSITRSLVRSAYLAPHFTTADLELAQVHSYLPALLFVLILLCGLAVVAWLLRLAARSAAEAGP